MRRTKRKLKKKNFYLSNINGRSDMKTTRSVEKKYENKVTI